MTVNEICSYRQDCNGCPRENDCLILKKKDENKTINSKKKNMPIKELCAKYSRCINCPFNPVCPYCDYWDIPLNKLTDDDNDLITNAIIETAKMLEPSKSGTWIEHVSNGIQYIECSECKTWFIRFSLPRNSFCPNCGCKMRWCNGQNRTCSQ